MQTTTGKLVRDAMFADGTYNIPISIWGETMDQLQEGTFYQLTDIGAKNVFGQKLCTGKQTIVTILDQSEKPNIDWQKMDLNPASVTLKNHNETRIENPDIVTVKVNFYPLCRKKTCGKKLTLHPEITLLHVILINATTDLCWYRNANGDAMLKFSLKLLIKR